MLRWAILLLAIAGRESTGTGVAGATRMHQQLTACACRFAWIGTAILALAGCAPADCDIDTYVLALAGSGAVDCGMFAPGADSSTGIDCALQAQAGGLSFRLRVDAVGRDSLVGAAWVRTANGDRYIVSRDSDTCGGSHCGARMTRMQCPSEFVAQSVYGARYLTCTISTPTETVCGR